MFGLDFSNLLEYVDTTSPEMIALAEINRGSSLQETAKITYNTVNQKFTYVSETKDNWQKPLETFARGLGDCEDLSVFLASLFTINNIPNWLLVVRNNQWPQYHVLNAIEVNGRGFTLLDPSTRNSFGSKPYYQDKVIIYGFYSVNSNKPSFPLFLPIPLNAFIKLNSSLYNSPSNLLTGN